MTRIALFLFAILVVASAGSAAAAAGPDPALVARACVTCHSAPVAAAGLMLDKITIDQVGRDAEVWEKVARKLRTGLHPPASLERPPARTLAAFADAVERELDRLDAPNWDRPNAVAVTDMELAARLASFLWRSWPD